MASESKDRRQVDKKLHTNLGFFKTIFILVVCIGVVAIFAAVVLLGFLAPIFNFLSIQSMLLDLQDGNFVNFTCRLASCTALFVLGYFLHRIIRSTIDARKRPRSPHTALRQ